MTITTRFATPADAATICAICSAAWRVTYKDLNPPGYIEQVIADFYNLDRVTKECSTSDQHWHGYMVAELDGHILGAIGGGVSEGNFGHIYVLYVHPEHKGKGLGRALVNFLTDHQKATYGINRQQVTVAKNNQMGIPFYERMGFVCQGEIPSWYDSQRPNNLTYEREVDSTVGD
ncbi:MULTISPECIES: N-acetyltransferase family protein [unclassified Streptococcus]|uniref:GNAT family N-acetyltransferase n=1 Tax=unclassified Streptococcus TaxID=2608887 RepID=UPI00359D5368